MMGTLPVVFCFGAVNSLSLRPVLFKPRTNPAPSGREPLGRCLVADFEPTQQHRRGDHGSPALMPDELRSSSEDSLSQRASSLPAPSGREPFGRTLAE